MGDGTSRFRSSFSRRGTLKLLMPKRSIAEISQTIESLVQRQMYDNIAPVTKLLLRHLQTPREYGDALRLLHDLPDAVVFNTAEFRQLYAELLSGALALERLEVFAERTRSLLGEEAAAPVRLEYAIALQAEKRHAEARAVLERIRPVLHGEALGVCWAWLGWSLFELKEPWEQAFEEGLALLSGLSLARALMNQAYCWAQSGDHARARLAWSRALPLVRHRASTTAVLRYNLAISAQRELLSEAEEHFLELERLTRVPSLHHQRAKALNGLALYRRSLGEWSRALTAYREALAFAQNATDRRVALNGLARTQYLSAHPGRALEVLEEALFEPALDRSPLLVTRALVLLALNDVGGAAASLGAADALHLDSVKWLARIAEAELSRRAGRLGDALRSLEGLPVHGLHAREEARQFPELMRLLETNGARAPEPLLYTPKTVVRVEARGVLRVFVNARGVNIGAVSRVGELLVFLLEQGGSASTEVIGDALYPQADAPTARKSVWALVKLLRRALGWAESVLALRGAYQLDPSVVWEYDIAEARARGDFKGAFLSGVYSDWVLEVERSLLARRNRRRSDLEMN
jgi:tetratricopeptide (TPR) repeat protein